MTAGNHDVGQSAMLSSRPSVRDTLLVELEGGFSEGGIRHRKRAHYRRSLTWVIAVRTASALRRVTDIVLSALLMILLSPVLGTLLIFAKLCGGGIRKEQRLGRWAAHFYQYELHFPTSSAFSRLTFFRPIPVLLNIFKGEMSFIGPRAVSPDETLSEKRSAWKRYDIRPGLLSLWWIRKRANIAFASEVSLDLEYVETKTLWGDLGIAVRAIPVAFLGGGVSSAPPQLKFLGVRIDNLTMAEASAQIIALTQADEASQVCFVNADCVNIAFGDEHYRATLSEAKLVLADGIGVRVAGAILNQNVRENVNGTDMLPYLCAAAEQAGVGIYLLGGRPGIAEGAYTWIAERYPCLKLSGFHHGYFTEEEQPQIVERIKSSGAGILLAALGAPRQDKWIAAYKNQVGAKVSIGVGGLLDFYSGRIPRAPAWVRELGMEWFYRFWQEPRRMWRRYFLGNAVFLYRVARERLRSARCAEGIGS
jgi:N-acetylglucosaminyldiphosphoundecaprenol N-acetyl-beta-D-mannosaminyltransferase